MNGAYGGGGVGGAIFASGGTLQLSGSTFGSGDIAGGGTSSAGSESGAGGEGGALFATQATVASSGNSFSGSSAEGGEASSAEAGLGGNGGALAANLTKLTSTGDSFTSDTAQNGAAVGSSTSDQFTPGFGGAIYVMGGTTAITGATFSGNAAWAASAADAAGGQGGAISLAGAGTTTVGSSTFTGNSAQAAGSTGTAASGGAIVEAQGNLLLKQSTLSGNTAPGGQGGAIYNSDQVRVIDSTLSGNSAKGGGAIADDSNPKLALAVDNSTIAANNAANIGGGILQLDGALSLDNATLDANSAAHRAGNLFLQQATATFHDTLFAGGSPENCAADESTVTVVSEGYNLEDGTGCNLTGPGDQRNATPLLGQLTNNGGSTQTVALLPGSPAIDAGDPAGCTGDLGKILPFDQRGVPRPQGPRCDIGAYEFVPPPPQSGGTGTTTTQSAQSGVAGSTTTQSAPPQDSGLTLSPTSFAAQTAGPSIAKHRAAQGTTVSYSDTQAATTTVQVQRPTSGIRVGGGPCTAPPKHRPRHAHACTLYVTVGSSFTHADSAGTNRFHFTGRVSGRRLAKGSYRLAVTPLLGGRAGATLTATFSIVS